MEATTDTTDEDFLAASGEAAKRPGWRAESRQVGAVWTIDLPSPLGTGQEDVEPAFIWTLMRTGPGAVRLNETLLGASLGDYATVREAVAAAMRVEDLARILVDVRDAERALIDMRRLKESYFARMRGSGVDPDRLAAKIAPNLENAGPDSEIWR